MLTKYLINTSLNVKDSCLSKGSVREKNTGSRQKIIVFDRF